MIAPRSIAAAALASAATCASAQCVWTFGASTLLQGGPGWGEIAFADVNNDGAIDIVASGFATYLNDGNGNFTHLPTDFSQNGEKESIALGDMNNDGNIDAVVAIGSYPAPSRPPRLAILLGNGAGVFEVHQAREVAVRNLDDDLNINAQDIARNDIELADLNGDGSLDVILGDKSRPFVRTLLNYGSGSVNEGAVQDPVDHATLASTNDIVLSDLDGDGYPDILVGHADEATDAAILWGGPGMTFSAPDPLPADCVRFPTIGDIDGDNDDDIVVGTAGRNIRVLRNDGQRQFVLVDTISVVAFGLAIDDFDGDGIADIAATAFTLGNLGVQGFTGDGAGAFSPGPFVPYNTVVVRPYLETADLNADGRPDLVAASEQSSIMPDVLLNNSSASFEPPAILQQPTGQIVPAGGTATFTVDAATNSHLGVDYQWFRNGQALTDAAALMGAKTPVLTILTTSPADIAEYWVEVSVPSCSGGNIVAASNPVVLAITGGVGSPPCPADTDNDSDVDLDDLLILLADFGSQCQ